MSRITRRTIIPVNQITPLTYRDGVTYIQLLTELSDYIKSILHPSLQHTVDQLVADVEHQMDKHHDQYVDGVQEFQRIHDAFMSDVNAHLIALNDGAVTDLVNDETSKLGATLRELFPDRETVEARFSKTLYAVDGYTLYVNGSTGSDTNDGSQSNPFKTVEYAIETALEQTTTRAGQEVVIQVAAGVYEMRYQLPDNTPFPYRLRVVGAPYPEGGSPVTVMEPDSRRIGVAFLNRNSSAHLTFENLLFRNYDGSASSGGLNNNNGHMASINCHYDHCHYGVSSFHGTLDVPSGVFTNCSGAGIRSMMQNRHSIGIQGHGSRNGTVTFQNNNIGFSAAENSTGHVDWSTFRDNNRGVQCNISSRVNADGSLFEGNNTAIHLTYGSNAYLSANTVIRKSNTQTGVSALSNSTYLVIGKGVLTDSSYSRTEQSLRSDYTRRVSSGGREMFYSQELPGEWFDGTKGLSGSPSLRLNTTTMLTASGSGTKTLRIAHLGYGQEINLGTSFSGPVILETEIVFISQTRQVVIIRVNPHLENTILRITERGRDMSNPFPLRIDGITEPGGELIAHYTELSGLI